MPDKWWGAVPIEVRARIRHRSPSGPGGWEAVDCAAVSNVERHENLALPVAPHTPHPSLAASRPLANWPMAIGACEAPLLQCADRPRRRLGSAAAYCAGSAAGGLCGIQARHRHV